VEIDLIVWERWFTGKSQEAPQLAVGRNGKRGFGGCRPHYGFFLGISPGHIARTSSRNKMKNFRFEAPGLATGRFTWFYLQAMIAESGKGIHCHSGTDKFWEDNQLDIYITHF